MCLFVCFAYRVFWRSGGTEHSKSRGRPLWKISKLFNACGWVEVDSLHLLKLQLKTVDLTYSLDLQFMVVLFHIYHISTLLRHSSNRTLA
jgi:hypothetical protein